MLCKCFIVCCLWIGTVLWIPASAQNNPHFLEMLSTQEGLSSNNINDIVQDDNGFLWIATTDGLNRFDGTEVTQFFYQEGTNSIPHNYVYCLKKLPNNYIAIGTQAGLSFYNGNTGVFLNFYYEKDSVFDEYNNTILKLEIDSRGFLWVGTRNCIFIFDTSLNLYKVIFSSFTKADAARERLRFVEKILPLPDGHVLLALHNGWHVWSPGDDHFTRAENSLLKKQLEFLKSFFVPQAVVKTGHYFPYSQVFKIFDRFFLCIKPGADSLLVYNNKGVKVSSCFFPYNKYPYVSWSHQVSMIDSTRLLFLFHNYGLAIVTVNWQDKHPVIHNLSEPLFEKTEYVYALRDRQRNWWLATTEEGLQKISPYKQLFNSSILNDKMLNRQIKYEMISGIRYNNTLWIATYGDGFFEIDLLTGKQQQHRIPTRDNETVENFIWNVRQVSADTLWVGTQAGMFWYRISTKQYGRIHYPGKPALLDSVSVTTQFVDSRGLVWMGLGKGKGVCYFDTKNHRFTYYPATSADGYPLRYPTSMKEDKNGNLWFVNDASTVLVHWDRNSNHFRTVILPRSMQKQLSNLCGILYEDSLLWLGSITSGLIKYHIASGAATIYGHERGLANSHVSDIYKDHANRLWVATDGGLSCFDRQTEIFTNYTTRDGLPVKFPTAFFFYDEKDKRLYNGGQGAYFYFDPDRMNLIPPPQKTMITALRVNGKPYILSGNRAIKFKSNQNDITISYSSVDLTNGAETKYAYKLIGEDTSWSMADKQRQINFSHLAPGKYTFMVRAYNNNGVWSNETASISFYIRPPFTQTIWFYILIVLGMAAAFYGLYHFRLRQVMKTEQIRSEISKNLHDEVGSTLTNISLSSLLAQKQLQKDSLATPILERIYQDSQNVSEAMREIVWSINPKIDTVGEAFPRMLHYASELLEAKNMELWVKMAPEIEQIKLTMQQRRDLYLIFKEAVNNLAKHSNATQVTINFQLPGKTLVMIIADNGTGFDMETAKKSNGLKNMKERAQNHHWNLNIQSEQGMGTTVKLEAEIG